MSFRQANKTNKYITSKSSSMNVLILSRKLGSLVGSLSLISSNVVSRGDNACRSKPSRGRRLKRAIEIN